MPIIATNLQKVPFQIQIKIKIFYNFFNLFSFMCKRHQIQFVQLCAASRRIFPQIRIFRQKEWVMFKKHLSISNIIEIIFIYLFYNILSILVFELGW